MTEEKRYYTPDISEFHTGFEVEVKLKKDSSYWMPYTIEEDWATPPWIEAIELKTVRVKHLDKEDIEAEGWETGGNNIYSIFKLRYAYHLIPSPFDANKWEIRCTQPSWRHGHFMGQILNRSELKFQMKRLGIV